MAKKKPEEFNPKHWWLCTECGQAYEGKDPPDECSWCGRMFFDNMFDLERELAECGAKGRSTYTDG